MTASSRLLLAFLKPDAEFERTKVMRVLQESCRLVEQLPGKQIVPTQVQTARE